ncbi:SDR family oxidoreductase [Aeromonas simiae]|uniref:SDR family oxidoreductase n=1 Tax=Aeromonas simiae TaxID=218936 RepID=A0A5J6WYA0_9GAMM|nr:SDR family oxidoreductase [Aeromonas simiae]MDO2947043.1 SDR family oxidoreductase [Aeromonas simiae]MDO2950655.1 SDR family oxidoreductase [Aeromonas simiae]MDO2954363.1 SDR family oxidoreductase [Aeromonas simiae]QFI55324.1 SDR family oxidoreductase [Aeromonas simiae]
MANRYVLITGCSSGIGLAAARGLRQHGFSVIASTRSEEDAARLRGEGLTTVRLDLRDPASIEAGAAEALYLAGGRLYGLFNNGAYGQPGALEDLPTEALREQLETNLIGWHHLIRLVLPGMLAAGEGRIVQNSSVLGLVAMRYRGAYNASKFALEGYSDTLRLELAGSGVHVSLIEPGPIDTQFRVNARDAFLRHVDPKASRHKKAYRQTLKRLEKEGPSGRFTLPPESCLPPLVHALSSRRPKARYPVTFPTRLFSWLRRLLPTRWLDRLLVKSA